MGEDVAILPNLGWGSYINVLLCKVMCYVFLCSLNLYTVVVHHDITCRSDFRE